MKKIILLLVVSVLLSGCVQKSKIKNSEKRKIDKALFAKGVMTPELLWKLGRVSDIQLSPDKKTILYSIKYYDLDSNKGNADLYTISVEGGEPIQVTDFEGSEFNGIWRPDGKKIGFLYPDKSGATQLWEMNPDGSDKKQVTDIKDGVNGFSYSPTLDNILFIKDVKLDKSPNDIYPDLPKANVKIAEDLMYRHWDSWHDYAYSHIFVATYKDGNVGELKDIMKDETYDSPMMPYGGMEQINWSSDGKQIAYVCKKLKGKEYAISTNSEIYVYNTETGKTENISNGFMGYDFDPVFSPDGNKIVWKSMATPGCESDKERIILYDFKTNTFEDLAKNFDQWCSNYTWSSNGEKIYFISGINATFQIYNINVGTKEIKQITHGQHDYQSYALADNSIIGLKTTMNLPTEIFRIDEATGKETQLTFTNKEVYDNIKTGNIEERWITTTDNKKMLTWIIYPPNFDKNKKYPAILFCQGGPQNAVSQNFHYRWNFQLMAANGYIVIAPNRRGLPTFGQAWNDQISGDYGGQNMKDYLSAVDEMVKEPYINKDKIGAVGASYGGFSVFWLAGHHEKRFKAFISHCGMFNLESQYASTEEYFFPNHDLGGPYWQNPKPKSYSYSPHLFVDKWDTPIMIISGYNDFRIPYTESLQAFNCAQLKGVPSKLLIFPEESHFVLKPQDAVLWQREFFGWLDKWLK